ncbi:MAG TPA: hypothetical protein VNH65_10030 [Candidatus Acidoferrum sp.]|nr:hypothetical protein [Candidatus Acidoferrum sp.]
MARTRTTKKLAQRVDLNYFKRPTGLKRAKFWLSVGLPALALVWIAWHGFSRDSRVYSSGRMSEAHAVLEAECTACHVQTAGAFSAKASDTACLACHDGPIHHARQISSIGCATCHTEHRGRVNIVATRNESCATCHGDLKTSGGADHFESGIHDFEDGHPQFAALRPNGGAPASDPGTIKVNHAIHMKPIRRGPNGPNVQLVCGDCHQPGAASGAWIYADAQYTAASTSSSPQDEVLPLGKERTQRPRPLTGRELMAPVRFAYACAGCHSLAFDKRFDEGVPHDKPEVVQAFLVKKFSEYIAAHPGEMRVMRDPGRDLTGKPIAPTARVLTQTQWVRERTAEAEDLLWRKTCKQCHTLSYPTRDAGRRIPQSIQPIDESSNIRSTAGGLPEIASAKITLQWMPHARFDHDAHRGFSCVSCHEKAMRSTETSEVLLPGIATCKTCHAPGPGHAESRCFECHTYHDWSKRKEIKPTFILPELRTGGR